MNTTRRSFLRAIAGVAVSPLLGGIAKATGVPAAKINPVPGPTWLELESSYQEFEREMVNRAAKQMARYVDMMMVRALRDGEAATEITIRPDLSVKQRVIHIDVPWYQLHATV